LATWVKEGEVPKPEFFAHQLPFNVSWAQRHKGLGSGE
jgi:hypothetical protein